MSELNHLHDSQISDVDSVSELRQYWLKRCLNLLARREHSIVELTQKLTTRGCPLELANALVAEMLQLNYLNEERFAYSYAKNRADLGYGPICVKYELKQHNIEATDIDKTCREMDWERAKTIAERKIRHQDPIKRRQALYRRGFISE